MDSILGTYASLDTVRREVIEFWARLVVEANQLAAVAPALDSQRKHVLDRASWAVTEIEPAPEMKLFGQRFWSHDALRWAAQTFDGRMRKTERGKLAASALRHEHVVPRSQLKQRLAACADLKAVTVILSSAVACVVTRAEQGRLVGEDGWCRYSRAKVAVFDRHLRRDHVAD